MCLEGDQWLFFTCLDSRIEKSKHLASDIRVPQMQCVMPVMNRMDPGETRASFQIRALRGLFAKTEPQPCSKIFIS